MPSSGVIKALDGSVEEAEISRWTFEMVDRNLLKDIGFTSVEKQPEIIETFEQLTQSQGRWIQFVNMYPFNQNTLTLSLR